MLLGTVTGQFSHGRISFIKDDTARVVTTGEYVQILGSGGTEWALVDSYRGHVTGMKSSFMYNCTLLGRDADSDLLGCAVRLPTSAALEDLFKPSTPSDLSIGELATRPENIPVHVESDTLVSMHSCFFGASGSGKSTLLKLAIEELLLKRHDVQVVIFDPNSDFAGFTKPRDLAHINSSANLCRSRSLTEVTARQAEIAAAKASLVGNPRLYLGRVSASDLLSALASDIPAADAIVWSEVWRFLNKTQMPITPASLRARLNEYDEPWLGEGSRYIAPSQIAQRRLDELHPSLVVTIDGLQTMGLWSFGSDDSLTALDVDPPVRLIQYDLAHLPRQERALFAEAAFTHLWRRNQMHPHRKTVVVIDEAHNLVPAVVEDDLQLRTQAWINRLAGEGRKYGLTLVVVSQRPAKIHPNTLDNCRNFFVGRLQNREDISALRARTGAVSGEMIEQVRTAAVHETLVLGDSIKPVTNRTGRRCVGN